MSCKGLPQFGRRRDFLSQRRKGRKGRDGNDIWLSVLRHLEFILSSLRHFKHMQPPLDSRKFQKAGASKITRRMPLLQVRLCQSACCMTCWNARAACTRSIKELSAMMPVDPEPRSILLSKRKDSNAADTWLSVLHHYEFILSSLRHFKHMQL